MPDPGSPLKWGETKITRNIQDKEYKNEVLHFCKKNESCGMFLWLKMRNALVKARITGKIGYIAQLNEKDANQKRPRER